MNDTSITVWKRDEKTGYANNLPNPAPRRSDGRIDWSRLIDPKHIVFNRKADKNGLFTKLYGAPPDELVYADLIAEGKEVDDRHVLVLLQGFIELADLRGYLSAPVEIVHVTPGQSVSAQCHITWLPNEEEPHGKTSSGEADADMENTGGFGFLTAIAGNRAFVRAVRRGLRIPILGFDEVAKKDDIMLPVESVVSNVSVMSPVSPTGNLQRVAEENKLTFDMVKTAAAAHWDKLQKDPEYKPKIENDPKMWLDWSTVPARDCLTLINLIKKRARDAKAKKPVTA